MATARLSVSHSLLGIQQLIRRLGIQTWLYVALSMIARVLNILAIIMAASMATPVAFGTFTFAQATSGFIVFLISLNMTVSLNVIVSSTKSRVIRITAVAFADLFILLISLTLIPLSLFATMFISGASHWSVTSFFLTYVLTTSGLAQVLFYGLLFGLNRPAITAAAGLMSTVLFVLIAYMLSATSSDAVLIGSALSALIANVVLVLMTHRCAGVSLRLLLRRGFRLASAFARRQIEPIFSFGFKSALNIGLLQIGLWALQAKLMRVAGQSDVAAFGVGAQFYNVVIFLPVMIGPLLLKAMAEEAPARKRRKVLLALLFCVIACIAILVGYVALRPVLFSFLPKLYGRSEEVVFWSILAGCVLFIKAPVSIYFQANFKVLPEGLSTTAAAAILIGVAFFGGLDANHAAMWRFISHVTQTLVIFTMYFFARRDETGDPDPSLRSTSAVS